MRQPQNYLFANHPLSSVINQHAETVLEKLSKITYETINSATEDELVKRYVDEFIINPLSLNDTDIQLETEEKDIDVSSRYDLHWSTPGPHYKRGTIFRYYVPFSGDEVLLKCQPSTFSLNPPYAPIRNGNLIFEYEVFDGQSGDMDSALEKELADVRTMIERVNRDIDPFNKQLTDTVRGAIHSRKEKLATISSMQSHSKYRLRTQYSEKLVYPTSSLRAKQKVELPIQRSDHKPEPHINDADYDLIIGLIKHTGFSIERSAQTYRNMGEEELRDVILTQLNGHYEGRAMGEAFNASGKTDILVRDGDRNVFIGECKIWGGAVAFTAAIDQLLSYAAWRDTKTALIIFNRNKNTSKVIEQIDELVLAHPNHKRALGKMNESEFRYILRHKADLDKELYLSVIILDVPN